MLMQGTLVTSLEPPGFCSTYAYSECPAGKGGRLPTRFSAPLLQETHTVLLEINKQKQSLSMQVENAWIQSFENVYTTPQTHRQERPLSPLPEKSCIILWAGLMSPEQGLETPEQWTWHPQNLTLLGFCRKADHKKDASAQFLFCYHA